MAYARQDISIGRTVPSNNNYFPIYIIECNIYAHHCFPEKKSEQKDQDSVLMFVIAHIAAQRRHKQPRQRQ